jgi:hypothetical protein
LEKVVVGGLKVKGKGTRTIQYPVTESEQGARENMWSGHVFIFACANLEGSEQKALMDAAQDQCVKYKKYRI